MRLYAEVVRRTFRRMTAYRGDDCSAAAILAAVADQAPVRDLAIEDPPIEEVIRRIYESLA